MEGVTLKAYRNLWFCCVVICHHPQKKEPIIVCVLY